MSDYTKATNFAAKDSLPSGNSGKIIKGTEIDTEYNAIASAVSSKADINNPTFTGAPAAPTATAGTNTTQLATTAFVSTAISGNNTTERTATATLTNKTISADNNTLSGIAASSFVLSDASGNIDGGASQKAIPNGVVVGTTDTQTLTNKTVALGSNTVSGTKSQFNTAVTDTDFSFINDFTGSNQSLATDGYQKFPGGLIIQWGYTASGTTTTFPIAFPTAALQAYLLPQSTSTSSYAPSHSNIVTLTTTGLTRTTGTLPIRWFAIGY